MRKVKKEIVKKLRENAGIIASSKYGRDVRNALCNSITDISLIIEEEELPVKKLVLRYYLKGVVTGSVAIQVLIIVGIIVYKLALSLPM